LLADGVGGYGELNAVAQLLMSQRRIDEAEACLSDAVRVSLYSQLTVLVNQIAATLPSYHLLSEIAAVKKQPQRALAFSGILETLSPSDGDSVFVHAKRLGQAGRWQEALTRLQALRNANPDNVDVVNSLGVAFYRTEAYVDAKAEFQHALSLDANSTDALENVKAVDDVLFGARSALASAAAASSESTTTAA